MPIGAPCEAAFLAKRFGYAVEDLDKVVIGEEDIEEDGVAAVGDAGEDAVGVVESQTAYVLLC